MFTLLLQRFDIWGSLLTTLWYYPSAILLLRCSQTAVSLWSEHLDELVIYEIHLATPSPPFILTLEIHKFTRETWPQTWKYRHSSWLIHTWLQTSPAHTLKPMIWRSQQNHVICLDQRPDQTQAGPSPHCCSCPALWGGPSQRGATALISWQLQPLYFHHQTSGETCVLR